MKYQVREPHLYWTMDGLSRSPGGGCWVLGAPWPRPPAPGPRRPTGTITWSIPVGNTREHYHARAMCRARAWAVGGGADAQSYIVYDM